MGVPKFFRYISERYPCLSEVVREYQIPEFDNLYLDMNGIIHMCSHPDDGDPHFRITEEKIFRDIFHYIEVLFRMIKPRKLFFMAVDGVAPRAKMNQQRGRRFRSAKEAVTLEAKARERGEVLPTEARFDSNCITPGTIFMARLHEQLKYFVVNKISTDKMWRNCKIILSGHETPGEGEHKIMDYIRYMRAQPGYDPNTRHCLYGLDADLIMLGLCTHEPHFSLLREEVRFGKKSNKRKNIPEQITFFLLHLSLMREYLELEFYPLKDSLKFDYDMEKIIDDWVLMGFLVGNDFIPHLPNMHIANGALPILYKAYMKVLPKLGGYINEAGTLNLERFEAFIQELSSIDIDNFTEKYADLKWFEAKTGKRFNEKEKPDIKPRRLEEWVPDGDDDIPDEPLESSKPTNPELAALIRATEDILLKPSEQNQQEEDELEEVCGAEIDSDMSDNDDDLFNAEFVQHKTDYYMNKLEYANVTPEVLRSQAEEYVRAIQWNLHYYYNGVCSWSWYYPHHYAPYVSDIKGFANLIIHFELGEPFKPYEQLLAVLPAASKSLLPLPYQELMTDANSPIKEYYPEDFKTDLNGKKQEWEAVVLIPFIEEDVLLKAMESCNSKLILEEQLRNSHGPMLVYQYSPDDFGIYNAPEPFPSIQSSHALCVEVTFDDIRIPREKLIKGAYPGVKFDVYYPGFPTMKHLKYEGCLEKAKVKVFEQPSRGDNMILRIKKEEIDEDDIPTLDAVAKDLLGKTVHVGWPHLVEALVVSISNREDRYHSTGEKGQYNVEENKGNLISLWNAERQGIVEHCKNRLGIDVGDTEVLAHVRVMIGRKYVFSQHGRITFDKQWADCTSAFPIQTVVQDISVYEEKYAAYKDIASVFPMGSYCFMLGQPCYGLMAEVLDSKDTLKNGRVKVCMKKYDEPDLTPVIRLDNDIRVRFMNLHTAATKLAISRSLFSRITGCVFVVPGREQHMASDDTPKINIGLNLKFNKKNEEVPGYTRKEGNTWLYSEKAIALVRLYMQTWSKVFEYLNYHVGNDIFYEEDIFPDGSAKECLREITQWMKQQPFYSIERQVCGSSVLDPEATQMLERVVDEHNTSSGKLKQVVMQVKPHLLYKPDLQMGNLMPDPLATFRLYDRVINVREGYTVPLGFKGTIIGIHKPSTSKEDDTLYDVIFDQQFAGGLAINCSANRGYRMPRPAIINISHGIRILQEKSGKPGQLQNAQSQGTLRNNYTNNPMGVSQNAPNYHPNSQFQPQNPIFSSWSRGCNFPVRPPAPPPVHNFNQYTYNYNPNFNGSYAHPVYNSSYASSPNYNNPGPNTFVPYKTNHFPLTAPLVPQHFTPPSNVSNGNERNPHRNMDEHKEVRALTEMNPVAFTQQPRPAQAKGAEETVKITQIEAPLNQFSKIDSDILKNLLRINDDANNSSASSQTKPKEVDQKENSTALSVNDFFALARSTSTDKSQASYYTAHLLKEFQARDLGIPSYQYFNMPDDQFMASLAMPNNASVIFSEPRRTKEEAAENVATKALTSLKTEGNTEQINIKPPSDAVPPEPPKQWQRTPQQQNNQASPQKSWSKPKPIPKAQEFSRSEGKQEFSRNEGKPEKRERIKVNQEQIHKYLNIQATGTSRAAGEESGSSGQHRKQHSITFTNSSFVPLQAVRQHRNRTNSSGTTEKDNGVSKQQHSEQQKEGTAQAAQPVVTVPATREPSKPRRERTVRIAANFQTAMSPKSPK